MLFNLAGIMLRSEALRSSSHGLMRLKIFSATCGSAPKAQGQTRQER